MNNNIQQVFKLAEEFVERMESLVRSSEKGLEPKGLRRDERWRVGKGEIVSTKFQNDSPIYAVVVYAFIVYTRYR